MAPRPRRRSRSRGGVCTSSAPAIPRARQPCTSRSGPGEVTLVVRGDSLAKSMSAYLTHEIAAAKNISVRLLTRIVDGSGARALESLTLESDAAGTPEVVGADALFVLIGARPRTS